MPLFWPHTSGQFSLLAVTGGKRRVIFGCQYVPEALDLVQLAHAAPPSCLPLLAHMPTRPQWGPSSDAGRRRPTPSPLFRIPAAQSISQQTEGHLCRNHLWGRVGVEMGAEGTY